MKPIMSRPPLLISLSVSAAFAGSLQAAVTFNVVDIGPALNSSSPATTTQGLVSSSIAVAPGPVTYTVTGLDFTSIGGSASDQIVFDVSFSATGGSVAYNNVPNGNVFNSAGSLANQIEPGETLTATFSLVSTTFAGGLANLSGGFTATRIGGASTGESWNIVHGGGTQAGSFALGVSQALPSSSFWRIQDVAGGATPGVNLEGYTVTLTAVPEPSAALLGGLGLIGLLRRRR
jgi:PEP-CTERM motif